MFTDILPGDNDAICALRHAYLPPLPRFEIVEKRRNTQRVEMVGLRR